MCFIVSSRSYETPNESKNKKENKRAGSKSIAPLEVLVGFLYGLVKAMLARDDSKPAGSEARGAGRQMGDLLDSTSKPLVAVTQSCYALWMLISETCFVSHVFLLLLACLRM